jgi:selenide,water dikinase
MADASGVTLEIDAASLPALPGALALAHEYLPCGGRANLRHFTGFSVGAGVSPESHLLCLDPQTSGGLLLAVRPGEAADAVRALTAAGAGAWTIGRVAARNGDSAPLVRLL